MAHMRMALALVIAAGVGAMAGTADGCTRVVYLGPDQTVMTGRTMDFAIDIPANPWVFPRGMVRHGEVGPSSLVWW